MSKRKPPTVATIAAGRRVVLSAGTLDGPFLAALAKVQLSTQVDNSAPVSTWGDGVTDRLQDDMCIHNPCSSMPERSANDGKSTPGRRNSSG